MASVCHTQENMHLVEIERVTSTLAKEKCRLKSNGERRRAGARIRQQLYIYFIWRICNLQCILPDVQKKTCINLEEYINMFYPRHGCFDSTAHLYAYRCRCLDLNILYSNSIEIIFFFL